MGVTIEERLIATGRKPKVTLHQTVSSQVWSVGYSKQLEELYVCYGHRDFAKSPRSKRLDRNGLPMRAGAIYCYHDVSPKDYWKLLHSKSVGAFMGGEIKPKYRCSKLLDGPVRTSGAKLKLVQHLR